MTTEVKTAVSVLVSEVELKLSNDLSDGCCAMTDLSPIQRRGPLLPDQNIPTYNSITFAFILSI